MKSRSIKKTLPQLAILMILMFLLLVIPMNILLQLYILHNRQSESVKEIFGQLEQVIQTNAKDLESEKEMFKETCIRSADMAAYYIEHNKKSIRDVNAAKELAKKLGVDEIHYFTPQGEIFAGTHPKYYGFTFDSGEQMSFFKPMLQDRALKLCQDITPNTAEEKEMQYAAVWMEDGSGIVQIGMEPRHLLQKIEEKSLQNVIDNLPFESNSYLHIVDKDTWQVIASTEESFQGKQLKSEASKGSVKKMSTVFHYRYNGTRYCIYTETYGDYILVRAYKSFYVISDILKSSGLALIYVMLGTVCIIMVIRWYIRKELVGNLNGIILELRKIEKGDLENISLKTDVTEFDELLFYINQMLNNIRHSWDKMNYLMDKGGIPIGIFEKNTFYKRVFVNERILDILGIDKREEFSEEQLADLVEAKLIQAQEHKIDSVEHIYAYDRNESTRYLRIEKTMDEQSIVYYVTDMTLWWEELSEMRDQSEMDELTGLYNRRGFYEKMNKLFGNPNTLEYGAIIMVDADDLKKINDCSGHHMGDRYLKNIANALKDAVGDNAVCARLGGDEFIVFIYGLSDRQSLEKEINRLKEARGEFFAQVQGDSCYTLQFSMGRAIYPLDGQDFHVLMRIADENMYQEKKERKNREGHKNFQYK